MAKPFPAEKEREFQELASYVCFFVTEVWGVAKDAPHHPSNYMDPIPGKISKSKLLSGARQAARDTLEATEHFQAAKVKEINDACRKNNVLTLSEIRQRYGHKSKPKPFFRQEA